MGTINVANFSGGVDRTRPIYALENGRLWEGIDGHITRGGDFEKRKAFVDVLTFAAGTFGFASNGGDAYVFGSIATPGGFPYTIASGVRLQYIQLVHPTASAMTNVISVQFFNNLTYVVAKFADGKVLHYYNGVLIADWYPGGASRPSDSTNNAFTIPYKRKMYAFAEFQQNLWFSGLDDPTYWYYGTAPAPVVPGAGFLNMASNMPRSPYITALGIYKNQLAVFSRDTIQLWTMDATPANNAPGQTVNGTGTTASKAVIAYGDYDVVYLSRAGVRSLRTIDYNGLANVQDFGTPIDNLVQETDPYGAIAYSARSCIDPVDGRLWIALWDKIFVFSYFPSKKIAAWTWYSVSAGFVSDFAVTAGDHLCIRNGNHLYMYGGTDGTTYDATVATCTMPFMSMNDASGYKQITGFDAAVSGTWNVDLLLDPNDLAQKVSIGTVDNMTYNDPNIGAVGYSTHVAPKLTTTGSTAATISSVALHFLGGERDTGRKK